MKTHELIAWAISITLTGVIVVSIINKRGVESRYENKKVCDSIKIDSLHKALIKAKEKQYYETGWTLVKINGDLSEELQDSVCCYGTFGLYRMFNEGLFGMSYKIQDIELNGSCTSFEVGRKLYIISKTPF